MLRRLHHDQPASFAFTPANQRWAEAQIAKFPEGRQMSAIIPLFFRAQEQEGWISRAAIEHIARMLDMPFIRALEVATFYYSFQLSPVGSAAHVQVCGTTPCMLRGAEDLIAYCQRRIGPEPHHPDASGKLSWEEVECLGACANAPMAQIGKDYYEDLSPERLGRILDEIEAGGVPRPGSQVGRFASEPEGGPTTLADVPGGREEANASITIAMTYRDGVGRIQGTEQPFDPPWLRVAEPDEPPPIPIEEADLPRPGEGRPIDETGWMVQQAGGDSAGRPPGPSNPDGGNDNSAPEPRTGGMEAPTGLQAPVGPSPADAPTTLVPEAMPPTLLVPRGGQADDLTRIKGLTPEVARLLNDLGVWHLDQIAGWKRGEVAWVNSRLGPHRGAIERDDWVGQARALAGG